MKKTVVLYLFCIIFTLVSASVFAQTWTGGAIDDLTRFNNTGDTYTSPYTDEYIEDNDLSFDADASDDEDVSDVSDVSDEEPAAPAASVPSAADSAAAAAKSAEAAIAAAAAAAKSAEAASAANNNASGNAAPPPPPAMPQAPVRIVIPMMAAPFAPFVASPPGPLLPAPTPPPLVYSAPVYPTPPPLVYSAPVYPSPPMGYPLVSPPVSPPLNVIPAMPSPYSNSSYRVQVGAFSSPGLAQQCFARLLSAGFSPIYEPYGSVNRIVLPGIRAADMPLVVQRLAAAGFSEVWIREER